MSKQRSTKRTRSAHMAHGRKAQDEKKIQIKKSKRVANVYFSQINAWFNEPDDVDDVKFIALTKTLRKMKKIHERLVGLDKKIEYHEEKQVIEK